MQSRLAKILAAANGLVFVIVACGAPARAEEPAAKSAPRERLMLTRTGMRPPKREWVSRNGAPEAEQTAAQASQGPDGRPPSPDNPDKAPEAPPAPGERPVLPAGFDQIAGGRGPAIKEMNRPPVDDDLESVPNEEEICKLLDLDAKLPKLDSINPAKPAPIPEHPFPHEGNLFDDPYIVNSPDMLTIEVLEALPFRNVTGEYLVRPDGTINLGWYGSVYVRGLTLDQVKVKVILVMRKYLKDSVLGLWRIEQATGKPVAIPLEDTTRVMVNVSEYNSAYFSVEGDVAAPGSNPVAGSDTVLFAIQRAGGFISIADVQNIQLYRPARGTAPARRIPIDYEAILQGDAKANLQLFKGDRLVVGRKKLVKETVAADQVAAALKTHATSVLIITSEVNSLLTLRKNLAEAGLNDRAIRERLEKTIDLWFKTQGPSRENTIDAAEYRRMLLEIVMPKSKEE